MRTTDAQHTRSSESDGGWGGGGERERENKIGDLYCIHIQQLYSSIYIHVYWMDDCIMYISADVRA
jgi:hypothetical protein